MAERTYDVVVIGGGSTGENVAQRAARGGCHVAVVESPSAVAICTGSRASIRPVPGLADARPWTSRDATSAREVPARLAILGGGVVACEMATAYAQLGAQVTVMERSARVLGGVPEFAAEAVTASLRAMGVEVATETELERVVRRPDGSVELAIGGTTRVTDQILVAAGRAPRTDDLGLETVGLEPGRWLDVDEHLQVTGIDGGWLYAAGDVNHRALLTHMGKYQARVCGDVIAARARRAERVDAVAEAVDGGVDQSPLSRGGATPARAAVPQVIFTIPEVAAVGLNEGQARERGLDVRTATYDIGNVAGASVYADDYAGRAELVVDVGRRVVVGMTLVGPGLAELLHAATIAVVAEVPLERLWHAVPSYPTISEVWLRLLEDLGL